jgi:hypothetical protein
MGEFQMHCRNILLGISLIGLLSGCVEQQQTQRVYVSPQEFSKYNCKQIAKDMAYTSSQYNQIAGQSDNSALLSTALAAYMVSQNYAFTTDSSENPQAAYLKAKYDALHQAGIEKNCD